MRMFKVKLAYTHDSKSLTNEAIRRVTGGPAHVVIAFIHHDETLYFESIWKKDPVTKKDGVRGPLPIMRIQNWLVEKPGRTIEWQPVDGYLPFSFEETEKMFADLCAAVHTVKYAKLQIVQNWISGRANIRISRGEGTRNKWTCCEAPVRVFPLRFLDCLRIRSISADDFFPGGDSIYSLRAGVDRIIKRFGVIE